jgi:hypothetical protein
MQIRTRLGFHDRFDRDEANLWITVKTKRVIHRASIRLPFPRFWRWLVAVARWN